ncbi:UNVERIFIED_CONTAM: hypothetical protein HDU68_004987, partial [Siphonaria sp. JEL0065]
MAAVGADGDESVESSLDDSVLVVTGTSNGVDLEGFQQGGEEAYEVENRYEDMEADNDGGVLDEGGEGDVMVTQDGVIVPVQLSNTSGNEEEGVFIREGVEHGVEESEEQGTGVEYDNTEYYQDEQQQQQLQEEEQQVYPEEDQPEYINDNADNSTSIEMA